MLLEQHCNNRKCASHVRGWYMGRERWHDELMSCHSVLLLLLAAAAAACCLLLLLLAACCCCRCFSMLLL
jgi:hypothetical protein